MLLMLLPMPLEVSTATAINAVVNTINNVLPVS